MTGLDKIINQIQAEAELSANQIMEEARASVKKLMEEAQQDWEERSRAIQEKSKTELLNYHERIKSSADFKRRTALLKAKQEIIADLIEKAYQALTVKSADQYFAFIEKVIRASALPRDGEIYFSQNDLSRLPEGFENIIHETAAANQGSLKLMNEPKDIENGFVLVYGGIEENCTFRALFDAKREQLQDKAYAVVFA